MFNTLYKKCLNLAAHKSSKYYLAVVSFVESSFFPIPPDIMIIPMVISKKNDFIKIFVITTIFSVLGGILGYFIGAFFYDVGIQIMNLYKQCFYGVVILDRRHTTHNILGKHLMPRDNSWYEPILAAP